MPSDQFVDFSNTVEAGVDKAVSLLNERKIYAPIEEIRMIVPELAEQEANKARVRADRLAHLSGAASFPSPAPSAIVASSQMVATLSAMTAVNNIANEIIATAASLMGLYNATAGR